MRFSFLDKKWSILQSLLFDIFYGSADVQGDNRLKQNKSLAVEIGSDCMELELLAPMVGT